MPSLHRSIRNRTVQVGKSYTQTNTVTLPSIVPSIYHLILKVDAYNSMFESCETNNTTEWLGSDQDGMPDWMERVSGTDPYAPVSVLGILPTDRFAHRRAGVLAERDEPPLYAGAVHEPVGSPDFHRHSTENTRSDKFHLLQRSRRYKQQSILLPGESRTLIPYRTLRASAYVLDYPP